MLPDAEPFEVSGQVKWYDPVKGFGFLLDPSGGPDILIHANVLRSFGHGSLVAGARVRVSAARAGRGVQAVAVLDVTPPATPAAIADLLAFEPAQLAALPFLPARVKWFDRARSFGFANLFGTPGDVFLHADVLRHGGFSDLAVGEAVALKVIDGKRGPIAAEIGAWDRRPSGGARDAEEVPPTMQDARA